MPISGEDPIWYAFYLVSLGERAVLWISWKSTRTNTTAVSRALALGSGFDPLRDEPRFKAVLAKLALPYTRLAATEP